MRAFVRDLPDYELSGGSPFADSGAGLRRAADLLDVLGRPDARYRVAQVAGTNGKGSTSAMLASILRAAGARVGLFTSPHLRRWEERIRVDDRIVDDDLLAAAGARVVEAVRLASASRPALTRFEFWTALACESFARTGCDAAVLEVGLGGRYDATTAAHADLAVITRVALDHTAILGPTLADVAREKAAIVRSPAPVVAAPQQADARDVIVARAVEIGAPLVLGGVDFLWKREGEQLAVVMGKHDISDISLGLRGAFQDENAATAIAAALTFDASVSDTAVRRGVASARWPGRFEVVGEVIVDGAHNPDGARALAAALREAFPVGRVAFVFGCMADKDLEGMLAELAPLAGRLLAVRSASPRARPAEDIADAAFARGVRSDVAPSVAAAMAQAGAEGWRTVVCGSLAIAAEARAALGLDDEAALMSAVTPPLELARKWIAAVDARDANGAAALVSEDCRITNPAGGDDLIGPAGMRELIRNAPQNIRRSLREERVEGTTVIVTSLTRIPGIFASFATFTLETEGDRIKRVAFALRPAN